MNSSGDLNGAELTPHVKDAYLERTCAGRQQLTLGIHVGSRKWTVYGRVDRFGDANPDGARIDYLPIATNAKYTFVLTGVEYPLLDSVRVGPNVEWVTYDDPSSGPSPGDDVVLRGTFYWVW